jgi:ribonuclease PH
VRGLRLSLPGCAEATNLSLITGLRLKGDKRTFLAAMHGLPSTFQPIQLPCPDRALPPGWPALGMLDFMRPDGRAPDELRPVSLFRGFAKFAEGSCLIKMGETHVLVTATVEERVPPFLKNSGKGWITAEYAMLPRSGRQRNQRDTLRPNSRSLEISRLIGRAIRCVADMDAMGERTITLDCDAIQADGGTRTAAITAAYVACYDAMRWMIDQRMIKAMLLNEPLAAVSVGVYRGTEILDLNYDEDSSAATDMNVAMTESGKFVEIQGTAEQDPFSAETLGKLLKLAKKGVDELIVAQRKALGVG